MPLVEVTLVEGRTPQQLRDLQVKLTDAVVDAIAAPRESIRVILRELPTSHFAIGGVPISELRPPSAEV
ncbi:MAG: 2-hydroxymuconate tautomerase [Dermatophilaceae bacterium]